MTRFFAILLFLLSGLPAVGYGLGSARRTAHNCSESGCMQTVVRTTCCGDQIEETFCPMSGGACTCGVSAPDEAPHPTAPLPQTDHSTLVAIQSCSGESYPLLISTKPIRFRYASSLSALTNYTHNETQAILGIWRT